MFADGNPYATQLKMVVHANRLAQWQQSGDTFPVLIEINPTNYCNEACDWCISKNIHLGNSAMTSATRTLRLHELDVHSAISNHPERRRGIELAELTRFLDQAKAMGLKAVNWSGGGEPTTYMHFAAAVRHSATIGLEQGLLTNGLFSATLVPTLCDHLRWVRVSLDTLNAEKYEARKHTRGFNRVVENIESLSQRGAHVIVNMNLAAWNFDEIEQLALWARQVGARALQVRPILGVSFDDGADGSGRSQPTREWLQEAKARLMAIRSLRNDAFDVLVSWDKFEDLEQTGFGRSYKKCLYHFFICVLNANGDLAVCMYHLDDQRFTFGNIYHNSVEEIWSSRRRADAIAMCANTLDLSTCQTCCKGHEINKFMQALEEAENRADVNFL